MEPSFKTTLRVNIKGYPLVVIPYVFCRSNKIEVGDHLLVRIRGRITHCLVSGNNSSKFLNIDINLLRNFKLQHKEKITVTLIKRSEKRHSKIKTCKINGKLFLDLYHSLPSKQIHCNDELVIFELSKNNILVCGKRASREIEIPRFLLLDNRTFEIFGLYQGEGSKKHQKRCAHVRFANSNLDIINYFLNYFKDIFNLPAKYWTARIGCSRKIKSDIGLKNFWSKNTGIPLENFIKTGFNKPKGNKAKKFGVLNVIIPSSLLTEVVMGVLDAAKKLSLRNKEYAKAFMRGVFAADAHVHLAKWSNMTTLSAIEIAVENEEESNLYKELLELIGIKSTAYPEVRKLNITHWDNLNKLALMNAFSLHPEKHKNFISGYNSHTKTTSFLPES
jgi:hypothetical protein